jgi:hypothetical protein
MTTTAMRGAPNVAIIVVFVLAIGLPCVGTIFGVATGGLVGENRPVAPPPDWSADFVSVRRQATAWFDDHFGFRNWLVRGFGLFTYRVFHVSISRDVVPGRGRWLFYDADRIVQSRRGLLPFTQDELAAWQTRLEERRDWLAARGIRYLFTIAPEKSSIYAEYLPASLQPLGAPTRADQLLRWMRTHTTVSSLDLRLALGAAKSEGRLYRRTDTHWNEAGAFAAYRAVESWLRSEFPALVPLEAASFERRVEPGVAKDLAAMMAIAPMVTEDDIVLVPSAPLQVEPREPTDVMLRRHYPPRHEPRVYECQTGELGRVLVVHDSFFEFLREWLAGHFRRSVFLRSIFAPEVILEEHPDVVIEEMAERVLSRPDFLPESDLAMYPLPR